METNVGGRPVSQGVLAATGFTSTDGNKTLELPETPWNTGTGNS